jgi:hypothetical protein
MLGNDKRESASIQQKDKIPSKPLHTLYYNLHINLSLLVKLVIKKDINSHTIHNQEASKDEPL